MNNVLGRHDDFVDGCYYQLKRAAGGEGAVRSCHLDHQYTVEIHGRLSGEPKSGGIECQPCRQGGAIGLTSGIDQGITVRINECAGRQEEIDSNIFRTFLICQRRGKNRAVVQNVDGLRLGPDRPIGENEALYTNGTRSQTVSHRHGAMITRPCRAFGDQKNEVVPGTSERYVVGIDVGEQQAIICACI